MAEGWVKMAEVFPAIVGVSWSAEVAAGQTIHMNPCMGTAWEYAMM